LRLFSDNPEPRFPPAICKNKEEWSKSCAILDHAEAMRMSIEDVLEIYCRGEKKTPSLQKKPERKWSRG